MVEMMRPLQNIGVECTDLSVEGAYRAYLAARAEASAQWAAIYSVGGDAVDGSFASTAAAAARAEAWAGVEGAVRVAHRSLAAPDDLAGLPSDPGDRRLVREMLLPDAAWEALVAIALEASHEVMRERMTAAALATLVRTGPMLEPGGRLVGCPRTGLVDRHAAAAVAAAVNATTAPVAAAANAALSGSAW